MRKAICLCLILLLALTGCGETPVEDQPSSTDVLSTETKPTWLTLPADRELTAGQYFVYDCETAGFLTISGQPEEKIYPASITKLFTAYVALQYLDAQKTVTAGDALSQVYPGSSVAGLEQGDELTVRLLIEAMMLPSGNDAAYVLAAAAGRAILEEDPNAGESPVAAFVAAMNRQAKTLGMKNTHFANPDGIHMDDHYSTFGDLALMGTLVQEDPVLMACAGTARDTVTLASGQKQWKNTNELIHPESQYYCPCAIGLKTGQTPTAGSCLLSAFEYEGRTLVIGVFGCPQTEDRFADTLQLFNETVGYTG